MTWKVEPEDWERHNQYDEWLQIYEEMFERTDTEWGVWTIVEATDRNYTRIKIFQTIINTLEERLLYLDAMPSFLLEDESSEETMTPPSQDALDLPQEPSGETPTEHESTESIPAERDIQVEGEVVS